MLDTLNRPIFVAALAVMSLAVLAEAGSLALLGPVAQQVPVAAVRQLPVAGMGVPALVVLDSLLLFTLGLMAVALLIPQRVQGRLQGIATVVVAAALLLWGLFQLFAAITALLLMVTLLMAAPFGTLAYMAAFGGFNVPGQAMVLWGVTALELVAAALLLLSHPRFVQNKGLVLLMLTSLVARVAVAFLHGLVPGFLASITDAIGAIVVLVMALVWALFFLVWGIVSMVKAIA